MAVKQETVTVDGSFSSLSISRTSTKTGDMTWALPSLPYDAVILSTSLTASLSISMFLGSCTATIKGQKFSSSSSLSFDLGTTLIGSLSVSAKGNNIFSYGTLSISNIVYSITYQYEESPPVITIVSQSKSKISGVTGHDSCEVSFTSDKALSYWEARATLSGVTPAHGVGLLVESGTLSEGETGYVYVDDEELTNGDGEYTVNIYGQGSDGVWSDDQ